MASLEIHPLSALRDEAAELLRERYDRQRAAEPLLPDVDDFEAELPPDGHVATRGGDVVAYLGGEVDSETKIARWLYAGHAAREPEALRDLFAVQAGQFEVSRFMLTVPAADPALIDVWFRLAFGCQAVWAVREVGPGTPADFGGTIRASTPDDIEAVVDLDELLYEHQATTPSFSELATPPREQLRAEASDLWDDPDKYVSFAAERDGHVVGLLVLYRRPKGDLRVPEGNIDLAFAATSVDAHGSGVGVALTNHAFSFAFEHGYRSMTVDWRAVNLLSSRFWPRRGFRPQYLRLYRAVP
jgi:ribosomal protein S18 acetylase RimI-like enzyme